MTNVVVVKGSLARPASDRVLPSGDRLVTLDVTVPGAVKPDGTPGRAESVPAAWFAAPAWLLDLEAGEELVLVGRVRRRFFQAGGLQSRTEVVVEEGAPARRTATAAGLVRRAVEELAAAAGLEAGGFEVGRAPTAEPKGRRKRAAPTFP